jgi:hypothetical protein
MCGRRAPDLPIDVAPRIGKAKTVVGQRHSAVQTVVKNEGSILVSRGELVWMGFEKLMLIFCWDALARVLSRVFPALGGIRQRQDRVPTLRIHTSGYAYRKSVIAMQKKKWNTTRRHSSEV